MDLIEILTIILLILASVLCVALIYYIYQIVKSVHSISLNMEALSYSLNPLIESTLELSNKINLITNEVNSQLQMSKSIVSDIRNHADKILDIESEIRNRLENAVAPVITNIVALRKGIGSFWRTLKSK